MMKNIIKIILALLLNCYNSYSQGNNGFELRGEIKGLKNNSKIYLISSLNDTITTAISKGPSFIIKGNIDGAANYYFLKLDTNINKVGKSVLSNALWLINSKLSIEGGLNMWRQLILKGSKPHDEYMEMIHLHKRAKGTGKENDILIKYVKDHPNSLYISDLILKLAAPLQYKGMYDAYNKLSSRAKSSFYGNKLKNVLENIRKGNLLQQAEKANDSISNFKIKMIQGDSLSIYSIASKSKYTLIDFWASWCAPCRDAIPEMKRVYKDFHELGFNIVGISTDKKESDWKKAVSEDKAPWAHGLDIIENAGKNIFGLAAIPGYILIDKNGKIIQTEIFSGSNNKIKMAHASEKSLSNDLYEIVGKLLKEEKDR